MNRARIRTALLAAVLLLACTGLASRLVLRPFPGAGAVGHGAAVGQGVTGGPGAAVGQVSMSAMGANVIGAKYLVE